MTAKKIISWIWPLFVVAVIFLLSRFFLVYRVSGDSMNPTIYDGTVGVAVKTNVTSIQRNDVIIVNMDGRHLIKRVIGLPGETIYYENNILFVNYDQVEDSHAFGYTDDFRISLGPNEYFVLGDNREHSSDSRQYGSFTEDDILAVIISER